MAAFTAPASNGHGHANWSMRIEYLHYDFGDELFAFIGPATTLDTDIVRLGVNYRF